VDFDAVLKRLGKNMRKARWIKGWTQQEAASATGINYRYLQELERGIRNPSLRMMFDLAQAFEVRVVDLLDVGERTKPVDLARAKATPPKRGRKPTKIKKPGKG
jgi:transcriptional regulator with XRE-family HTH domain